VKSLMIRSSISIFCLFFFATALSAQTGAEETRSIHPKIYREQLDVANLPNTVATATPLPTTVLIRINDTVAYVNDVSYDKLQSSLATSFSFPKPDAVATAIGDIREINGRPAKGLYVNIAFPLLSTPDPSPVNGITIGDSTRIASVNHQFDIQTADGRPIGALFGTGLAFGDAAPGAPEGSGGGSVAIIGGTGPYIGIKGAMFTSSDTLVYGDPPSVRFASAAENPAMRRVNKGGVTKWVIQLFPTFSPDAVLYDDGTPAVFHTGDQSLVTIWNPATPGELLYVLARNLGPTNPQVFPGQPFPKPFPPGSVAWVNSPVEIQVNDKPVEVKQAIGVPSTANIYDVTFAAPNAPSGINSAQIFLAFVGGVKFPLVMK
jgi:uncharacterized protein (TIGR03437 family)